MRNGKLQVGVIGVGGIGREQHVPAWAKVDFAELAGVADVSEEALARAAAVHPPRHSFKDWQELIALNDLDIVDICTPNQTHTAIALAALAAGKHVLCEKPLATTAAEVRTMMEAAHRAGRLLMAAQHFRFDPVCRQLKDLIDAGLLGEVYYARAQYLRRRQLPTRPTFIEKRLSGGGPVFDVGVHVLDLAYWYMGAPEPVAVSALVTAKLAHQSELTGSWGDWDRGRFNVEDFAAGFVRFANGAVLTLETSWLAFQPDKELIRLQCLGTRGGLTWPDGLLVGETNRVPWEMKVSETPKQSAYQEEILAFATAVRDGLPCPIPVLESLQVVRILEGFYQSAEAQREVVL